MKRVLALFLSLQIGLCIAGNSIIAIVDEEVITLQTIELELKQAKTFDEKIAIIEQQIENTLQLRKAVELGLNPSQKDINGAPIIAPPPNPIIAIPVAIPLLSGNHLIRVDTGET